MITDVAVLLDQLTDDDFDCGWIVVAMNHFMDGGLRLGDVARVLVAVREGYRKIGDLRRWEWQGTHSSITKPTPRQRQPRRPRRARVTTP